MSEDVDGPTVDSITENRAPDGSLRNIRITMLDQSVEQTAYHHLGYEIEDGPVFDYHNVPSPWESNDRYGSPEKARRAADAAVESRYGSPETPLEGGDDE